MFQQLKQELMVYTVSSKAVGIKRNGDLRHIYKKEFTELVWQCDIEKDKGIIQGESQGLAWTYIKRMQVLSTEMGNQKGQQVWSKFYKEKRWVKFQVFGVQITYSMSMATDGLMFRRQV